MERYAVSWPDASDTFDGIGTARFATLREAIPCAVRHSGVIRNMKERPADGGKTRFYNEPGEWSATGVPWGYARDCFIAAAYTTLLDFDLVKGETLNAAGYGRSDVKCADDMRFVHECIHFYCDMLRIFLPAASLRIAERAGELFIHTRCGTGLDFMAEDKLFGGHGKARLFTEYARTYEALVPFLSGETISILWSGRVQQ